MKHIVVFQELVDLVISGCPIFSVSQFFSSIKVLIAGLGSRCNDIYQPNLFYNYLSNWRQFKVDNLSYIYAERESKINPFVYSYPPVMMWHTHTLHAVTWVGGVGASNRVKSASLSSTWLIDILYSVCFLTLRKGIKTHWSIWVVHLYFAW